MRDQPALDEHLENFNSGTYRNIHHLNPKGISNKVVCEDYSALQACINPSLPVWVSYIQPRDSDSLDLVGRLRNSPFNRFLIIVGQN